MQCRGQQMPEANEQHIFCQYQYDQNARIGDNRCKRALYRSGVHIHNGIHQMAGSFRHPNSRLADESGDKENRSGQRPGFLPAIRHPIGAQQAPERRHPGHGRPLPCLQGLLGYLPLIVQSTHRCAMRLDNAL